MNDDVNAFEIARGQYIDAIKKIYSMIENNKDTDELIVKIIAFESVCEGVKNSPVFDKDGKAVYHVLSYALREKVKLNMNYMEEDNDTTKQVDKR